MRFGESSLCEVLRFMILHPELRSAAGPFPRGVDLLAVLYKLTKR
jgi:hypothetical protein